MGAEEAGWGPETWQGKALKRGREVGAVGASMRAVWAVGAVGAVGAGMRWKPLKTSDSQWPRNVNGLAGALKRSRGRLSNVAGKGRRWAVWAAVGGWGRACAGAS